jgi:hypothetical protein
MVPVWLFAAQLGELLPARFVLHRDFETIPISWTLQTDLFAMLKDGSHDFDQLVHDVSGEKGLVLAESLDVAVLGNHPVGFEPFAFSMLETEGRWNSESLVDTICAGQVRLLVLSYPIDADIHPVGLMEFPMWPNSVMVALRASMQLESIRGAHWLYRPLPAPDATTVAECKSAAASARQHSL